MPRRSPATFLALLVAGAALWLGSALVSTSSSRAERSLFDRAERGQTLFEAHLPLARDLKLFRSMRGLDESAVRQFLRNAPESLFGDWIEAHVLREPSDERRAAILEELVFAGREFPLSALTGAYFHAGFASGEILAKLLREEGSAAAIEALVHGLDRVQTRKASEEALFRLGEVALPALMRHGERGDLPDPSVFRTIGRIGGTRAAHYLEGRAEEKDYALWMATLQGRVFLDPLPFFSEIEPILIALPPEARLELLLRHPSIPVERVARYIDLKLFLRHAEIREKIARGDHRLIDLLLQLRTGRVSAAHERDLVMLLGRSRGGRRALLSFPPSALRDAALFLAYGIEEEKAIRDEIRDVLASARGEEFAEWLASGVRIQDHARLLSPEKPSLRVLFAEIAALSGEVEFLQERLEDDDSAMVARAILPHLIAMGALPEKKLLHRWSRPRESRPWALLALALHGSEGALEREALLRAIVLGLRSDSIDERRLLLLAAGITGDRRVCGALLRSLRASEPTLRTASLYALSAVGCPSGQASARALRRIERDPEVLRAISSTLEGTSSHLNFFHSIHDDRFHDPVRFMLVSEAIQSLPIDRSASPAARSKR